MRPWLLGVALVLAAAGAAAADEKAEAVVKKGIEAHGGADNLNKYAYSRFTIKGDIDIMGMSLEFTGDMASGPARMRMNMNLTVMGQALTIHQVINGDKGKRSVKVGDQTMAQEVDKDDAVQARIGREVEKLTPLLDAKRFTLRADDDADVNGKKAALVVATAKEGDREYKLYFDKESGLLVKFGHKAKSPDGSGEVYQEAYPSDYKKVNGVQMANKLVIENDGKKFLSLTLSDLEVLEKLDEKEFKLDD